MTAETPQIGPEREQRLKPTTVFDVVAEEIRFAELASSDKQLQVEHFNEQLEALEALYAHVTEPSPGEREVNYDKFPLLDSMQDYLGLVIYRSAEDSGYSTEVAEGAAMDGALFGVSAQVSLLPKGQRTALLNQRVCLDFSDVVTSHDDDIMQQQYNDGLRTELDYLDQQIFDLPIEAHESLNHAAELAGFCSSKDFMYFKRGFMFAQNRMLEAVNEAEQQAKHSQSSVPQ